MRKVLFLITAIFLSTPAIAKVCVKTRATVEGIYDAIYPVNAIYISASSTNPADVFGFGVWERFGKGRALVGVDEDDAEFDAVQETGGTKTHTLTIAEMPSHTHITRLGRLNDGNFTSAEGEVPPADRRDFSGYTTNNVNQNTGGGAAHNNMPPYITVYMWRRVS